MKTCEHCGTTFTLKRSTNAGRFCSRACKNEGMRRTTLARCTFCGVEFSAKPSRIDRYGSGLVFCSRKCHGGYRTANPRRSRFEAGVKPHLRPMYGTACFVCGFDRVVEYAHLISAASGGSIHPDNIVPLCPNHHTLLDRGQLNNEEFERLSDRLIYAWGSHMSLTEDATPRSATA